MKHLIVSALVVLTFGSGCDNGSAAPESDGSAAFNLPREGSSGKSYGSLRVVDDGTDSQACWRFTIETLPKAAQLHQDLTGPTNPVVATLYEPPNSPKSAGCIDLDSEIARGVLNGPEGFYVDGHISDKTPTPVIWASLEPEAD